MIFGLTILTLVHVAISLIAILAGIPFAANLLANRPAPAVTSAFLLFTALTTLTGFVIFNGFTPAFLFGVISTVALVAAIYALYTRRLAGPWRWIYVASALFAFYLNCFVLIVQSFLKVPPLHALAPLGNEPPFAIAQGVLLLAFLVIGWLAHKRFHPATAV